RIIINNNISLRIVSVADGDHLTLSGSAGTLTGATFSVANYPAFCNGQCFYDITTSMDPADATGNTVFVGGNPERFTPNLDPLCPPSGSFTSGAHSLWKTTDGGASWRGVSQGDGVSGGVHTDDHALVFDSAGGVLNGNDGGIWRSTDAGGSWTSMNTNIA